MGIRSFRLCQIGWGVASFSGEIPGFFLVGGQGSISWVVNNVVQTQYAPEGEGLIYLFVHSISSA